MQQILKGLNKTFEIVGKISFRIINSKYIHCQEERRHSKDATEKLKLFTIKCTTDNNTIKLK